MDTPDKNKMNEYLSQLLRGESAKTTSKFDTVLAPEDVAYLDTLLKLIHSGKQAILIVEEGGDKLKYMFSNASRAEAISMLGKVVEATGRRLANGEQ